MRDAEKARTENAGRWDVGNGIYPIFGYVKSISGTYTIIFIIWNISDFNICDVCVLLKTRSYTNRNLESLSKSAHSLDK